MAGTGSVKRRRGRTGGKRQPMGIFYNLPKEKESCIFIGDMMTGKPFSPYAQRILDLARKWQNCTITDAEYKELNVWYYALENEELGIAMDRTADKVEKRLHELLYKDPKPPEDGEGPPHPWH